MLAHAGTSVGDYGTDWLYLLVPLALGGLVTAYLIATGESHARGFVARTAQRAGSSLERITGLPAWCSGGIGVGLLALGIAAVGWLWDVAWHIGEGRDEFLYTPAHLMIAVGLGLLAVAGAVSVTLATVLRAPVRRRIGPLRVPQGALLFGFLGVGALAGFPLDEFWHAAYGIDVTMWGPTHLVMISGASLSPIAHLLLLAEAGPEVGRRRVVRVLHGIVAGALLVGLSTFQGEFDFGVPQFQMLYHPVLIALASGIALTLARVALGRGGAVIAAGGAIAIRVALAWLVGTVLHQPVPHFALYLGVAVVVEACAPLFDRLRPLYAALVTGLAVGTVGLATEWAWTHLWGPLPWASSLLPGILVAVAIAVPATILGFAAGRILAARPAGIGRGVLALSGIAVAVLLALPLPRHDSSIDARIETSPAGAARVHARVTVRPHDAAEEPDWFEVMSWQGGALVRTPLRAAEAGTYETADAVPVGGEWKTLVRLARHDVLVAAPIYMPADPEIGASKVPVEPVRVTEFRRDTELLQREAHGGPAWPSLVAYGAIVVLAGLWIAVIIMSFASLAGDRDDVSARWRTAFAGRPKPAAR